MSIEVKVSVKKGKSRLFQIANEDLTLIDLRRIMEKKWEEVGSNFLFLKNEDEIDRESESEYKLSKFKKDDHIEVVVSLPQHSDDKKTTAKNTNLAAKDASKALEDRLISDNGSQKSDKNANFVGLKWDDLKELITKTKFPKALKVTPNGLEPIDYPGIKLSTEVSMDELSLPEKFYKDDAQSYFTEWEKETNKMFSHEISASIKMSVPQLSAKLGLDVSYGTTSESQTQSKKTYLYLVAQRFVPKVKVVLKKQTIQVTDEFKQEVKEAKDLATLRRIFENNGYFVPTTYIMGGKIIAEDKKEFSEKMDKTEVTNKFKAAVSGEMNRNGLTAEGKASSNSQNTSQSTETNAHTSSQYQLYGVGGDEALVSTRPGEWTSSLTVEKWRIISYENLMPITDFLPQDLKEKCEKLLTSGSAPLNKLPKEVAEEMSEMAKSVAWYTVNKRKGEELLKKSIMIAKPSDNFLIRFTKKIGEYTNPAYAALNDFQKREVEKCEHEARNNELAFNQHFEKMSKRVTSLQLRLSPKTLENIKQGALSFAELTAKHCVEANDDSRYEANKINLKNFNECFESVKNSKEVTPHLAEHIQEMCKSIAWYAGNKHLGNDNVSKDLTNFKMHYQEICE
jgi:hypothetical protein